MIIDTDIIRAGLGQNYRAVAECAQLLPEGVARVNAQMVLQAIRELDARAMERIEELATKHGAVLTGYRLLNEKEIACLTDERWSATAWGWVPATPCIIQADMGPVRRRLD